MNDLMMLYSLIIGLALVSWAFSSLTLYRGLAAAFLQERQKHGFKSFLEYHKAAYLKILMWAGLYVCLVGYASARLLYMANLWSLETALIGLVVLIFFAKERVHYITALFVVERMIKPS